MSNLPDDVSYDHPNFNDPTTCANCAGDLDDDLFCPKCDAVCDVCGADDHRTDNHGQQCTCPVCLIALNAYFAELHATLAEGDVE